MVAMTLEENLSDARTRTLADRIFGYGPTWESYPLDILKVIFVPGALIKFEIDMTRAKKTGS